MFQMTTRTGIPLSLGTVYCTQIEHRPDDGILPLNSVRPPLRWRSALRGVEGSRRPMEAVFRPLRRVCGAGCGCGLGDLRGEDISPV